MAKSEEKHAPIRQSVHVDCDIEDAFRLFTEELAAWWPLASNSVAGEESESCTIEPWTGGRVLERTRSGAEHEWGSVIAWDPPRRVEFTWHPGAMPDDRQTVNVEFRVEADGTRVTLTHRGWELAAMTNCSLQAGSARLWQVLLQGFTMFVAEQMLVAV